MKAKRLPQEGMVLEVIENLHEVLWSKIASGGNRPQNHECVQAL